jgi:hypothetical protein
VEIVEPIDWTSETETAPAAEAAPEATPVAATDAEEPVATR